MMHNALNWKNAWRVRVVALSLVVIIVGVGTQVVVNAIAANTGLLTLKVSAYSSQGRMADGNWTYAGACSVPTAQFPFGTIIALYNGDGSFNRQCTAEDSLAHIAYSHILLAMPGNQTAALQWGTHIMTAQVQRWGWGGPAPIFLAASASGEKIAPHRAIKLHPRPIRPGSHDGLLRLLSRP